MSIDLQALKDEIIVNPVSMPYLALDPGNDEANADVINNKDGTNPRTVNNDEVSTAKFCALTTFGAYDGLTASETSYYDMITNRETVAVTADTLANFAGIGGTSKWAAADRSTMEPLMAALMQRVGSRAEELRDTLGATTVTPSDVANARQLP